MTTATQRPTLIDIDLRGLVPDSPDLAELAAEVTRRCGDWHALTTELAEIQSRREALTRAIRQADSEADRRDARRELRGLTADARDLPDTYAVAADEFARALDGWTTHLLREVDAVFLAASDAESEITVKLSAPRVNGRPDRERDRVRGAILERAVPARERQREAQRVKRELLNKRRTVGLREGRSGVRRWVASQREIAASVIA